MKTVLQLYMTADRYYHKYQVTLCCDRSHSSDPQICPLLHLLHGPALPFHPLYLPSRFSQLEHLCSVSLNLVMQNGTKAHGQHLDQDY